MRNKIYFDNLDALRTIACFIVMASHMSVQNTFHLIADTYVVNHVIGLLTSGGTGVSVFFVLSGFLISFLLFKEKEKRPINIKHFYLKRVLRIWPLYLALGIYAFGIYPFKEDLLHIDMNYANSLAYYSTFLSNFDMLNILADDAKIGLKMVSVTWSVSIEEQFYLIWPLLFFLNRRFLSYLFIVIIAISITFRIMHYDEIQTLYFHSLSVVMDLTVGALIAYLSIYSNRFKQFFQVIPKSLNLLIYLIGLAILIFQNFIFPTIYDHAILRFFYVIFFAYIIAEQNMNNNSFYKLGRFKWLSRIGKYTYSLYMLHLVVLDMLAYFFRYFSIDYHNNSLNGFLFAIIGFAGSGVLAYLSYKFMETPFLKLKEKITA
jgi:peptidoglycan/LPS O-acetylase OafA/YrhL